MIHARPLWVLGSVVTSNFVAFAMLLTLAPLYSLELGASAAVVGILTASISFFPLLFAVWAGTLVDRFGSRGLLTLASALLAAAPLFVLASPTLPALFATQILAGLANLLAVVAGQALTAALGTGVKRESNFGWYTTFVSAGQVVGPLLAGLLFDLGSYVPAYGAVGATALVSVVCSRLLPSGGGRRAAAERTARQDGDLRRVLTMLSAAGIQFAMLVTFVVAFTQGVYNAFFPVILEGAAFTATWIGLLLSLRAFVSMVLRPLLPRIVPLLGNRRSALVTMVGVIALAFALIGIDQSFVTAAAVSLLIGVGFGLAPPLSIVMMVDGAAEREKGFALGVRLTANRMAQLVGPLAVGLVADRFGLQIAFMTSSTVAIAFVGYLRARAVEIAVE